MEEPVKLEQTEGIAIITLNRAKAYNSFDVEMVQLLADILVKLAWDLVTEVVKDGASVKRSIQMLEDIKRRSLTSFAASKKLMTDSFSTAFEAQLERERELLSWCVDQPNGREGVAAFLEKRKPVFNENNR